MDNSEDRLQKPESWKALVADMSPELHASLKTAVELGKWPNGERLSPEQQEHCLQAIIAWDALYQPEQERVGFINRSKLDGSNCND